MKRIIPDAIYEHQPCSVVALGCAMGIARKSDLRPLKSAQLRADGYLSLRGMNELVRANLSVIRQEKFKRGERPVLRDFAHAHLGQRAVICVLGHYIYFDGRDYYSYFWNGQDDVVSVWYLDDKKEEN